MRHIFAIGMMACGLLLSAKTLTPEEALQRVYANQGEMAKAPASQSMMVIKTFSSSSGTPALYLFEGESADWMVVSANDIATPLLGYGEVAPAGSDIPPQMEWWLNQYAAQIAWADSVSLLPENMKISFRSENGANKAPTRSDKEPIAMLMNTKWNQDNPYNKLCPKIGFKRTPTGCVATALAQIMKYHQYPESGNGIGHATVGDSSEQLEMDLNIPLRWDAMKNVYSGTSYTTDQANAVAELMVSVGYASGMNYNLEGSGAYDYKACNALIENFSYANSTWLYMRDYYTLDEWEDMLYEELAANRPVYYSGRAADGGHAFVCDGYSGNGYFNFNWGWGGLYNGKFKIDALNPEGQGIGGFEGGYNTEQIAIMGIQPPTEEAASHPAPRLSCYRQPKVFFNGNNMTLSGEWYNYGYKTETFTIAVEIKNLDLDQTFIQEIGTYDVKTYSGFKTFTINMSSSKYKDGTYSMQLVTKTPGYPDWYAASGPTSVKKTAACRKYDGVWLDSKIVPLIVTDADYPKTFEMDTPAEYSITLQNINDEELSMTLLPYICYKNGNVYEVAGESDEDDCLSVTVPGNSTMTFTHEFTITSFDDDYKDEQDLYLVLVDCDTFDLYYVFGGIHNPSGVEQISDIPNSTEIYTIDGVRIHTDPDRLLPGIYIAGGKKIIIRR